MTAAGKLTIDTNVLIYAIDSSVNDKHQLAGKLLVHAAAARQPLMLQSLDEFCAVATRKRMVPASKIIETLNVHRKSFTIVPPNTEDLFEAIQAQQNHQLSFRDALLWATARRAGCDTLLTEDFQDGRTLGGLRFINPFHLNSREIKALFSEL